MERISQVSRWNQWSPEENQKPLKSSFALPEIFQQPLLPHKDPVLGLTQKEIATGKVYSEGIFYLAK